MTEEQYENRQNKRQEFLKKWLADNYTKEEIIELVMYFKLSLEGICKITKTSDTMIGQIMAFAAITMGEESKPIIMKLIHDAPKAIYEYEKKELEKN